MTTDRRTKTGEEMKQEVLAKLSEFTDKNKANALKIHALIMEADPTLCPRLWYGMPGYAKTKDSAVLVFFREDEYMTFGLTENANFKANSDSDDLLMPSAWFFTELNDSTERKIVEIVRSAVS
jgi:hypothetical protein